MLNLDDSESVGTPCEIILLEPYAENCEPLRDTLSLSGDWLASRLGGAIGFNFSGRFNLLMGIP